MRGWLLLRYYVYMLKSKGTNIKTYVGWTNNLSKRLLTHNKGKGAKSTKGKEWEIIYFERFNSKEKAMRREYTLKKDRKFRNNLKKSNN